MTLDVVFQAKSVGLDLIKLPSHTSHGLQPLDVSIFKPFKDYFHKYHDYWSSRHLSDTVLKETLVQWVFLALQKALTEKNICSGFKATGIFPLDKRVIHRQLKVVNQQLTTNKLAVLQCEETDGTPSEPVDKDGVHQPKIDMEENVVQ